MARSHFKLLMEPFVLQNIRQRKVQRQWNHPFFGRMAWSQRFGEKVTSCEEGFKQTCIICAAFKNIKNKCKINSSNATLFELSPCI